MMSSAILFLSVAASACGYSDSKHYKNVSISGSNNTTVDDFAPAKTPQMGWNPWNLFGCNVNESLIEDIATSMVDSGLHKLGYEYINLDDCWQKSRDSEGNILEDPERFPSGIAALSETVHDLGLKFGLYSDSGLMTCQRRPGGLGHEARDAAQYAAWKIDYLKYDNCFATGLGRVESRYKRMQTALQEATANSTRPIFFSLCEWGYKDPATWGRSVGGNSWRTTGDIRNDWGSMTSILDQNDRWHAYAGPGGWNDPDMLQVGTTMEGSRSNAGGGAGLTIPEQRAHFTLWCLVKAPLLLANDLRAISSDVWDIISNKEIIAINQDPLGIQGYKRWSSMGESKPETDGTEPVGDSSEDGPIEVWAGDLSGGDVAVVLFNRSGKTQHIVARFEDVVGAQPHRTGGSAYYAAAEIPSDRDVRGRLRRNQAQAVGSPRASIRAHVRDLWAHADLGVSIESIGGMVPPHDVMAFRLSNITATTAVPTV